jgi:hypothetical protein
MGLWTEIAEKNAEHYDEHPTQHAAATLVAAAVAIGALVGIRKYVQYDAKEQMNRRKYYV